MDTKLRPSGIEGLGDMAWGTHFCLFYDTKADLLNILVPYVKAGLENNEFFLCVASPPLSTQEAQRAMHEAVPDFERYLTEGQIEIVSYRDWLLTGGEFETQQVLQNWIAKLNWALAKGYAGLRFLGDPSWLDEQAWGSVPKFEKQLDLIVSNSQMLGLCAYALERCSAADVLDVVNHHQFTVARRDRVWEHLESSELKRAHEEIRQLNADLERRVVERTAQLAAANEQLKLEITARKAAEESLREAQARTESVLASVADTHILLDRQWRYIYLNEAAIRAIGKSREQILGRTLWELYPDIVGTELDYQYRRAMDERLAVVFDFHYEVLDTWWANRFYPTPEGLAIFATEITERKHAEALLHAREQEFRAFVENATDQIIRYDKEFRRTYVNPAVTQAYGLPREAFIGKSVGSVVEDTRLELDIDSVTAIRRQIKSVFDTGEPTESEVSFPSPSGRRTYWTRMYPEFDLNGVVINVMTISREITERQRAEETIRKSEQLLREAESLGHTGSWEKNLVTGEIFHTEESLRLFFGDDRSSSKVTFLADYSQAIHPDDREYVMQRRVQLLAEGGARDIEFRVVWPDGSVHILFSRATVVYDELGRAIRVYGTNMDITERKQAEAELRQNKEILQTVFDNVPAMITMVDKDGRFILTNRDFENRLGWRPGEMSEQNLDMLAELYPDSQDREAMLDFAERADGRWEDFRTRAKDGRMIDTSWAIVRLSDGSIIGVGKDNTERKRAEEALRKSERVLREAEALGHTGSWEQDLVTGEIFHTEENLQLFFGDDRSKGANLEDYAQVVHPDDREYVLQRRAELLDEEGPGDIEYRVVWWDGSIHWIFGRATVVRDELGQVIRVYGTNVDITERKRAEEALREREKLLQLVLATLPVGVVVTDPADNIIVANPASKRIWGDVIISGSERRERSIGFWHDSGKRIAPEEWASLRALSKGQTSLNELIDIETFDGVHKIIRNSSAPIRNSEGIIVGAVFVNEDVTERKRAEEETKHQAARAETLARIAARLNKQLDLEAVIHAVCQEAVDTFKVSQAVISLYDKKRDLLDYAGGVNIPPQYSAKIESVSRAQFEKFVRTMGTILVVPDIQARPNANVPSAEFTFELNVRTVVTADMRRDQELIGVLVLGVNGQVREFDPDELTLLKAISDQAAQAIANAQLLKTANEQREELRNLSTRLVQVQEAERRAITTELHDRVGQNLTGLSIAIQNMKASLSNQSQETVAAQINDAQTLLEDTTRHIRDIMAELYLPELEDHGLAAALETYADRVASRANLDLVVDLPETPLRLSSDVRVALFRAAQEAISNVLKHADATQLEISLQRENGRVRLRVEDNGQGFEPSPESPKETPSWGLKIMRERIESIGGKVQIESKPGEGTRVTFEIERSS